MKAHAVAYGAGLFGVTLDGRVGSVVVFLCVALAAAAAKHWGGAWHRLRTRPGTGFSEG
jgi:hypothetical protein